MSFLISLFINFCCSLTANISFRILLIIAPRRRCFSVSPILKKLTSYIYDFLSFYFLFSLIILVILDFNFQLCYLLVCRDIS